MSKCIRLKYPNESLARDPNGQQANMTISITGCPKSRCESWRAAGSKLMYIDITALYRTAGKQRFLHSWSEEGRLLFGAPSLSCFAFSAKRSILEKNGLKIRKDSE